MERLFFILGAVFAALSVAMGAYGAHAGGGGLSPEAMITLGKAVRYNMYHALGLFVVVWALYQWPGQYKVLRVAGFLFIAGIVFFSGSLYLLSLTGISSGYITPLGGISFIGGWLSLAVAAWKVDGTNPS